MLSRLSSRIAAPMAGARAFLPRRTARGVLLATVIGLGACSTNNVLDLRPEVDVGTTAGLPRGGGMQDLVPSDPYLQKADTARLQEAAPQSPLDAGQPLDTAGLGETAGTYPQADTGVSADMGEGNGDQPIDLTGPPPMPQDEIACRRELKKLGVVWKEMSPIRDSASCQIDHPIKVSGLPDSIKMSPPAVLNCEMALTFAKWTEEELNPAARRRYWSRVKTIHQLSSYSCRRINRSHSMSEHSTGNALDVGRIELTSGRDIDVEKPGLFAFRTRGFLNTVRSDGCDYFTTVLGPGYNYDHRNHFHFDIKPRRGGRVACH